MIPKHLEQAMMSDTPNPVIALTVLYEHEVLVGSRNPETNITHPDVVSVPTLRIPIELSQSILEDLREVKSEHTKVLGDDNAQVVVYHPIIYRADQVSGLHSTVFATRALLSGKLGLGDAIEKEEFNFDCSVATSVLGYAGYQNLEGKMNGQPRELILMINILVRVVSGKEIVPPETASYSNLRWVHVEDFFRMCDQRDPSVIGLQDIFKYCVNGLCLSSTQVALKHI